MLIARHKSGVYFRYVLGNQTKLWRVALVALIAEGYRLSGEDCFAGFVYWFNLLLEPPRGRVRAKFAVRINDDADSSGRRFAKDVTDEATVADILTSSVDSNNVIGRCDSGSG